LEKLGKEYEVAKNKVRKYREIVRGEKTNASEVNDGNSQLNNSGVATEIRNMKRDVQRLEAELAEARRSALDPVERINMLRGNFPADPSATDDKSEGQRDEGRRQSLRARTRSFPAFPTPPDMWRRLSLELHPVSAFPISSTAYISGLAPTPTAAFPLPPSPSHFALPSAARTLDITAGTEVEMRSIYPRKEHLKEHVSTVCRGARREGAEIALKAAVSTYQQAANDYQEATRLLVERLASRLTELVEFLTHLFALEGSGALDFSAMSCSMREALQKSMEEGKRLSQSLSRSSFLRDVSEEDVNETQADFETVTDGDIFFTVPKFTLPTIQVDNLALGPQVDLTAELEMAKAEAQFLKVMMLSLSLGLSIGKNIS
jgi:hypothetical protein